MNFDALDIYISIDNPTSPKAVPNSFPETSLEALAAHRPDNNRPPWHSVEYRERSWVVVLEPHGRSCWAATLGGQQTHVISCRIIIQVDLWPPARLIIFAVV